MAWKEENLEAENIIRFRKAYRELNRICDNTRHNNRDTQIICREIKPEMENIFEWNKWRK